MARQAGPLYHEGTIGDIVYYKVGDNYFARFKGTYKSRRQMQRIPKFERTLQLAQQFGKASKIAGWVYVRYLPQELRRQGVFGQFTGKATRLLKEGKSEQEVKDLLMAYCEQLTAQAAAPNKAATKATRVEPSTKQGAGTKHTAVNPSRYLPAAPQNTLPTKTTTTHYAPLTTHNNPLPVTHCLPPIDH